MSVPSNYKCGVLFLFQIIVVSALVVHWIAILYFGIWKLVCNGFVKECGKGREEAHLIIDNGKIVIYRIRGIFNHVFNLTRYQIREIKKTLNIFSSKNYVTVNLR